MSLQSWGAMDGLPAQVGAVGIGSSRVLCIGPMTWLAIGEAMADRESLACVDVTDGMVQIVISGAASPELLNGVCALDLHPRAFPVDTCRRTRVAGLAVVIDRRADDTFECYTAASYSAYLLAVLRDGAASLGNRS